MRCAEPQDASEGGARGGAGAQQRRLRVSEYTLSLCAPFRANLAAAPALDNSEGVLDVQTIARNIAALKARQKAAARGGKGAKGAKGAAEPEPECVQLSPPSTRH